MARRQEIYTAKKRRADDGAEAPVICKKRAASVKGDGAVAATYRRAAPETKAAKAEKAAPAAKAVKTGKAAEKAGKRVKTAPAAREKKPEKAAPSARRAAKGAPPRREDRPEEALEKRRAEKAAQRKKRAIARERVQLAAKERRRALDRTGGFAVLLITLLTVAFDTLGLLLCAVRGDVLDTQALALLATMASLALATGLVFPRLLGLDALLMAITNFLCGVSVVILYTVTPERGAKQATFYAAGVAVMLAMRFVVARLRRWKGMTVLAMVLGIGALILPLAFGQWSYGAKNWVQLPVIGSFQPSEFVKLSLVLALAYYFGTHRTVWQMMPALVFAAACLVLLMLQRDLGTALIYYITTLVMFYAACGNVPLTLLGLGGGAGAAVLGYRMFAHVKVRVAMWRNPWSDALDKGYQIIQALLAIGSGGLFGVGLGQGTPEKIPAYYNDFIFAVVCEQLGMVFGICVILMYVLLIVRGVSLCMRARRSFDLLLGCGVVAMLGIQTFMIVAGVIKMIPLTGVTMPFLSYGGSSLVSCLAMMGILHGIAARAQDELEDDILGDQ